MDDEAVATDVRRASGVADRAPRSWAGVASRLHLPRLVGAVIVIWGAATLAFAVLHLIPGDPVDIMLGTTSSVTQEVRDRIHADLGLDKPMVTQYIEYLLRLARFDLGT